MIPVPELVLTADQSAALLERRAALGDLTSVEAAVVDSDALQETLDDLLGTTGIGAQAAALWATHDHFVVRDVPPSDDGVTALLLARAFFRTLKTYRGGRIVKHFKMSPWTTALSHTLAEGFFHTDLNTAERPPAATVMQCLEPDPDAPRHGQLRVVRLADLLDALQRRNATKGLRLLTKDHVSMVNDTSSGCWSGRITDGREIRFHPETLRAGQTRHGNNPADLDECLREIHEAAVSISSPIDLARGDQLFVSNLRALHYRSACTVRFRTFPRDFESRAVAVLHALSEHS